MHAETAPHPGTRESLLAAERALAARAAEAGLAAALAGAADPGLRLLRPDRLPAVGHAAALELAAADGKASFTAEAAHPARSGDLGYAYGVGEGGPTGRFVYLRIWKFGPARWKVVLDLVDPLPEPAPTGP